MIYLDSTQEHSITPKRRATESSLIDLWKEKQEQDKKDREFHQAFEMEEKAKDRELKERKLLVQQQQIDLEKARFDHQCVLDAEEAKRKERQLKIQETERASQLAIQNALLQMLLQKQSKKY